MTIIPITSNNKRIYPFEVLLESNETGLIKDSKAQCHQISTISKLRVSKSVPAGIVADKNDALKLHLGIT